MPLTIRERLMQAIKAELQTIPGATVKRNPRGDFDLSELPGLGLFEGDERSSDDQINNATVNHLEVTVSGQVTGDDDEAAATALNELHGQVIAAVFTDYQHGGLAVNSSKTGLLVNTNFGATDEVPLVGFELTVDVEYWTLANDATVNAA